MYITSAIVKLIVMAVLDCDGKEEKKNGSYFFEFINVRDASSSKHA